MGDGVEMSQVGRGQTMKASIVCPWRSDFLSWALGSHGWLLSSRQRSLQHGEWTLETFLNLGEAAGVGYQWARLCREAVASSGSPAWAWACLGFS